MTTTTMFNCPACSTEMSVEVHIARDGELDFAVPDACTHDALADEEMDEIVGRPFTPAEEKALYTTITEETHEWVRGYHDSMRY